MAAPTNKSTPQSRWLPLLITVVALGLALVGAHVYRYYQLNGEYFSALHYLQTQTKNSELATFEDFMTARSEIISFKPLEVNKDGDVAFEYFSTLDKTLVLPSNFICTPDWQAQLFAHGARHAHSFFVRRVNFTNPRAKFYEERDTWAFNHRLLRELKGKAWADLVAAEVIRLRADVRQSKVPIPDRIPGRGPYNPALDRIFLPALSGHERKFRQTMLWIDAIFRLIEQDETGDIEDKKAQFLKIYYGA
jgi:hypothetical protein